MKPVELLARWLARQLPSTEGAWLTDAAEKLRTTSADRDLYLLISLVSRRVGKERLSLGDVDIAAASASRRGWNPSAWTVDQASRVYLLLCSTDDGAEMSRRLDRLCSTADIDELVAFYRGLPLYPDQPRYKLRAAEGIRSNMRVVFEAVAQHNPYPAEQLDEPAWNQLVLKALFVGTALDPIVGLDERRNLTLARMLCDYARERWAASRPVHPELWRCVGPFARGPALDLIRRLFDRGTDIEQRAAALALHDASDSDAVSLLESHPELARRARNGEVSWRELAPAQS